MQGMIRLVSAIGRFDCVRRYSRHQLNNVVSHGHEPLAPRRTPTHGLYRMERKPVESLQPGSRDDISKTLPHERCPMTADRTEATSLWDRTTAPQSPYTTQQVIRGLVVFAIGIAVTVGIPLLLT